MGCNWQPEKPEELSAEEFAEYRELRDEFFKVLAAANGIPADQCIVVERYTK